MQHRLPASMTVPSERMPRWSANTRAPKPIAVVSAVKATARTVPPSRDGSCLARWMMWIALSIPSPISIGIAKKFARFTSIPSRGIAPIVMPMPASTVPTASAARRRLRRSSQAISAIAATESSETTRNVLTMSSMDPCCVKGTPVAVASTARTRATKRPR